MNEQRIWRWAALALATIAMGAMWHATTRPAGANATRVADPTSVAVIDVGKVLELLDERNDRQAEFDAEIQSRTAKIEEMESTFKAITEEIDLLPDGDRKREKFEEAVRLNMQIEFEKEFATRILAEKRKDLLLDMFNKIKQSTDDYAKAEGWDVVIVSDHSVDIPETMGAAETNNAILSRRVLSASDAVDITDEVAQRMNNEYARG